MMLGKSEFLKTLGSSVSVRYMDTDAEIRVQYLGEYLNSVTGKFKPAHNSQKLWVEVLKINTEVSVREF